MKTLGMSWRVTLASCSLRFDLVRCFLLDVGDWGVCLSTTSRRSQLVNHSPTTTCSDVQAVCHECCYG